MNALIHNTIHFVKEQLKSAEGGHDWFHVERVWKNTLLILEKETANRLVCELAALLHDVADSKFHDGDEELGPNIAGKFLEAQEVDTHIINEVKLIIKNMSYKASLGPLHYHSKEMEVVQDADRLDAIGAIGIARAFNYGGFKNRVMYDPGIKPELDMSKEAYKNTQAPTINHFYEKLLLLKDKMNTATAKAIAQQRHHFMEAFLEQFYAEWEGKR
ncbi:MAG: HD domain-containing protein [Sphingobacteriales bacterium]|nr:MAG: HD domain-containing protein [Sphingobacteriales bacterium]